MAEQRNTICDERWADWGKCEWQATERRLEEGRAAFFSLESDPTTLMKAEIWTHHSMARSGHCQEEYLVLRITPFRLEERRWITVVPDGSRMPHRYLRQQPEEREQGWWRKRRLWNLVLVALNMSAYRTFKDCSQVLQNWLYWAFILSEFSPFSHISWLFLTEDSNPRASCWLLLCSHDQLHRFLHKFKMA